MFRVEIYGRVRRAVRVEGRSQSAVAREFGLSRETVWKMLAYAVPPDYQRQQPIKRPKLGPWLGVIDAILADDKQRPVKQRHTATGQGELSPSSLGPGTHHPGRRLHELACDGVRMSGAETSSTIIVTHTADTPQLLLEHHLKELRLPTILCEYDKVARQCAVEQLDYPRYLLRMTELELLDRERRATERRIRQARFAVIKTMDSFDFLAIPTLNKTLVLADFPERAACTEPHPSSLWV